MKILCCFWWRYWWSPHCWREGEKRRWGGTVYRMGIWAKPSWQGAPTSFPLFWWLGYADNNPVFSMITSSQGGGRWSVGQLRLAVRAGLSPLSGWERHNHDRDRETTWYLSASVSDIIDIIDPYFFLSLMVLLLTITTEILKKILRFSLSPFHMAKTV